MEAQTLTDAEVAQIASEAVRGVNDKLLFTNLANKRAVAKQITLISKHYYGVPKFRSRTAHGSLLDPRHTVEGREIPDRGLGNDYKHYHPKLYCLESERRSYD